MKMLKSILASTVVAGSLLMSPVHAAQQTGYTGDHLYGACDHIAPSKGKALHKCLQGGRGNGAR